MAEKVVEALVDGGKATPAPPLGPALAVHKVNIGQIIQDVNEKTKEYAGMKVPIRIIIDDKTKEHRIVVGTPPISSLIKKELGMEKIGSEKKEATAESKPVEEKPTEEKTKEKKTEEEKPTDEAKTEEGKEVKKEAAVEIKLPEKSVDEEIEEAALKKKKREIVGNLTMEQCVRIAKMKRGSTLAKTMRGAVKEIVASCVSMPLTVEGKNPKDVLKEIDEGKWDSLVE